MEIDVAALAFDDDNEAKFSRHKVTAAEVQQVLARWPRFYLNMRPSRATHVMIGPTRAGRVLLVPIEPLADATWRPVTAYEPNAGQLSRYRGGRREDD